MKMNKPLSSIVLLMAPCLALMGMAFYLTRRAAVAPPSVSESGPLRVEITGVEKQVMTPAQIYEGDYHGFFLVFEAQGARPKGWGTPDTGYSNYNNGMKVYKFWLERGNKREELSPAIAQIYSTQWDKNKKHYYNEILLDNTPIPTEAALKLSGIAQINPNNGPKFGPPVPFEVTLKEAGQKWEKPNVSTDTGATLRKIKIEKQPGGDTKATAELLLAPDTDTEVSYLMTDILDVNWNRTFPGFAAQQRIGEPTNSSRVYESEMRWPTAQISKSRSRDLIITVRMGFGDKWPLEIAFPVKKDGKPIFGVVAPLERPTNKPRQR